MVVSSHLDYTVKIKPNAQGWPVEVTNGVSKVTKLAYDGADLSRVTDPLNRQTRRITDAVGRVMSTTDAVGARTLQD